MNRIITLLLLMVVIGVKGWGQNVTVSGALTGNGTYTTLSSAFTAIGTSQSGTNIIISITGNTIEPVGGAVLGAGTWTTLKITPSGPRIVTGATTAGLPLINLNGADNVTIDGLNSGGNTLTITNTIVSATAGTSTIQFINDATNNTIQNCTISGSSTVANSATVAGGTIVFSTGTSTGNDGNTITNNTITAAGSNLPSCAIYSLGTSAGVDNSGIQVNNNSIQDYFAAGGNSFGLFIGNYSAAWIISGNKFFQSATRTATAGNTHEAIKINTSGVTSGNGYTISNNTIGSATTSYAGAFGNRLIGIDLSVGTTNPSSVQGNTISNISLSTTSNAATAYGIFTGIYVSGGNVNIGTTTGNIIGATTGTGSIAITSTTSLGLISGITSSSTGTVSIQNNNIGSISTGGAGAIGYTLFGINTSGAAGNYIVTANTVGSTTTANSIAVGTSGTTTTGVCTFNGINNAATGTISITGNTIQNCSSFGSGASVFTGIINTGGLSSSILSITTNNIISGTLSGTGAFTGISNTAAVTTANLNTNVIQSNTISSATGVFAGISNGGAVTTAININNNSLGTSTGGLINYTVANSGILTCISNTGGGSSAILSVQSNDFTGITYSVAGSGSHTYINNIFSTLAQNISTNTFTNLAVNTTGSITFIADNVSVGATGAQNINSNSIVTAFGKTGAGGTITLFTSSVALTSGATVSNNNNNFSNITVTGATIIAGWSNTNSGTVNKTFTANTFTSWTGGSAAITAMTINSGGSAGGNGNVISGNTISAITGSLSITAIATGSSSTVTNISSNTVNSLASTGAAAVVAISIAAGTTANVFKNKVYDISSSNASGTVNGILISGGSTITLYNNIIGDLRATIANAANPLIGLNVTGGTTINAYYNTIYLNGSSTGSLFGSSAVSVSTASIVNLRNNVFDNVSSVSGTGLSVAYRRSSTTLTTYASTSNNNDFYGTSALYTDGTNKDVTVAAFKTRVAARDAASVSENPPFISTTGSSPIYLHINPAIGTLLESNAVNIASFTDDFDGDIRQGNAGYGGTGTAPDIGADEFNGTVGDITPPNVAYIPVSTSCAGSSVTLTATITDASGISTSGTGLPVLYYKINSGSYTSVQGVSIGSSQYTFSFGGSTVGGDIVSYYIVAQDNATAPNVIASPSAGAGGYTANPPAASTPPTTPSTYTAGFSLNGNYTVGVGGNFTTLTAAVSAYNNACNITGPVTFTLLNNISSGETFPLTINANSFASATNTLTIKPNAAGLAISGSSAGGLIILNGASYVTIDGSVSNTVNTICPLVTASRDLTITNSNTSTGSAVIWLQTTAGMVAATNNTIKNCTITGSGNTQTLLGIGSGSPVISISSLGTGNNSNSFINNSISKTQYGIYSQGANVINSNTGTIINQNVINSTSPNNVSTGGIYVGYENNITISGNTISNISGANTYAWGISCGLTSFTSSTTTGDDVTNAIITKNTVGSVHPQRSYGVAGIAMAAATTGTSLIANNMISDAYTNGTSGDIGAAIYIGGGTGSTTNIFYNAVAMTGNLSGATDGNFALAINGNNPVVNVKNNIFTNTGSNGSNLNCAIGLAYTTVTNLTSNYNDLYVNGTGAAVVQTGTLSNTGFTSYTTVTGAGSWNAASGKDANSVSILPTFVSASNLRLTAANVGLNGAGTPIMITDDIDCATRNAATPDIGVNEFTSPNSPVINIVTLSTPANCNAIAHAIAASVTSGSNPLTAVSLAYSYNGVPQTPVVMTGGTTTGTSTWTGNIPAATPANAVVTWSVTATDGIVTAGPASGASYQDAILAGSTITVGSSAAAVCSGGSFNLTATSSGLSIFSEGFEGSFPPSGWTFINAGTGNTWSANATSHTGAGAMSYNYSSTDAANAWGITPGQNLTAGQTYTISFWYNTAGGTTYPEKLKITVGIVATVSAQSTILWNNNGVASLTNTTYALGTATFTPATSGTYYFGFNCYSDANEFNLYVDDISLSANFNYTWASSPAGFTSTIQNPTGVTETAATAYNVTANYNGCSITSSPGVTVGITSPLSGIYSVGSGTIAGQAGHYATLTAAVNAYNSICLGGPVTFALTDAAYNANETFPITVNANSNANSTNTLTIKPKTGVTCTISGNNAAALLQLNGADYIIIDGSNTAGGTTQNLSFNNTNSGTSNVLWINSVASPADGATHDTIRNCKIAGLDYADNFAGIASTGSSNLTNAEAPNSYNAVINNTFIRSQEGVAILGCTTSYDNGWYVYGNKMGSTVTADQMSFDGVSVNYAQNFTIDSNIITGVVVNSFDLVAGIYVDGNILNGNIYNNKISNIKNSSTSFQDGSAGIYLGATSTTSNLSVYNNFISDVASYGAAGFTANDNGNGIVIDAGGGYNIYYNTVDLTTDQTTGTSAALWISPSITTSSSLNIRDNIFANNQSVNTRYSVYSTAANTVFAAMDYNDYWNGGTNLAYSNGNLSNLADVKTAAGFGTSNNVNSVNIQPVFVGASDLHLNTASNNTLNNLGSPMSGITTDIDADIRNTLTPDMGADEFTPCTPTIFTWTGATNTDWNTGSNWCSGTVPTLSTSVVIPAGLVNYPVISNTDAVAASLTINSSCSLTMNGTGNLTLNSGSLFTNNGTFTATASTGALIFNGSGTVAGIANFNNVTVNGAVDFGSTGVSTVAGNFTINSGGSVTGATTHLITYTSTSTLVYNTTLTAGNEWYQGGASTITPGAGIPQNVTIQSGTVSIPNSGGANRALAGNLIINSGTGLQMTTGSSRDLYIAANWTNSGGTFTANGRTVTFDGSASGQTIAGATTFYNLTFANPVSVSLGSSTTSIASTLSNSTGTMDGGTSTVIFTGNPGSLIGSNSKYFYNLQINSGAIVIHNTDGGNIHVSNSLVNNGSFTDDPAYTFYFDQSGASETMSGTGNTTFGNLTIGGGSLSLPTLLNTGLSNYTMSGNALSFNSNSSSISSSGTITFALATAGTSSVKNATSIIGTSANFTNVQVSTTASAVATALDFGSSISSISTNLSINNNGSVINNAPVYGGSASLVYNTNTPALTTGLEWSANTTTPGAGEPQNITIQNSNNILLAGDRALGGNLNIASTDSLDLNNHTLTLNGAISSTGFLSGSSASGLIIGGAAGTTHFKTGGANNVLQTFTVNSGGSVTLGDSLYITAGANFGTVTVDGIINTGNHFVLRSDINGTARVAASLGSINGNVTVERYIATGTGSAPNHGKSWQLLAIPTQGQTVKQAWQEGASQTNVLPAGNNAPGSLGNPVAGYGTMITSNVAGAASQPSPGFDAYTSVGPTMKSYNYITNSYDNGPPNTNATQLYNKNGYFVFVRGDRLVYTSTGTATPTILRSTGTLFTAASAMPIINLVAGNFESIGNPYASAIDIRNITTTGILDPFFYVWDPRLGGNYNYGAFETFYKSGGNYLNLLPSATYGPAGTINNYVQSGQAFFMHATSASTVSFTESAKAAGTGTGIFARQRSDSHADTLLRSSIYNINNLSGTDSLVDGVLNQFAYNYCACVDGLDARKAGNTGEALSIITNDTLLTIERRHTLVEKDTIFLHFGGAKIQSYRFSFDAQNLSTVASGFLEDLYTHTLTPLNLNGNTIVNFTVVSVAGSYAPDRFRIVFSPLKVLPVTFASIKAYKQDKNINVEWRVDNERNIKEYGIEKSADGKTFTAMATAKPSNNTGGTAGYVIADVKPTTGDNYYRIRSVDVNGAISYSTIVKVTIGGGKSDINIYPNPITDGQIHLQFENEAAGRYGIRLLNKAGQMITHKQVNREEGNSTELIKWDFNLAHGMYQLEVTRPDGSVKNINVIY